MARQFIGSYEWMWARPSGCTLPGCTAAAPSSSGDSPSLCLTAPKAGVGADGGQAGNPRSCGAGVSWCNGIALPNASACAAACCAIKPTGKSTMVCGGYTFDPKQADTSGGSRCPVGGPCCWLKQAPSALGKAPARYIGAVRTTAPPEELIPDGIFPLACTLPLPPAAQTPSCDYGQGGVPNLDLDTCSFAVKSLHVGYKV